jgi:hypothetical protein
MNDQSEPKYYDLHVTGLGFLRRVREVVPKNGEPFLSVSIAALHGQAGKARYTSFDCRVSGTEAQSMIRLLMPWITGEHKVLVGFRLSDLYAETFTYQKGDKQGQTGISLKGRLLKVFWVRVDGQPFVMDSSETKTATA